jgi:hypothetical protein
MLPHPVPSAEGTPFGSPLWVEFMSFLSQDAAGDKPVSLSNYLSNFHACRPLETLVRSSQVGDGKCSFDLLGDV